ncbi:hypothetical protein B0A55_02287 [Friedmanniomyces simplex]|uniref:Uncharacterized protein n=1 Tax=Friedmanniomyces simplex TaxID=329884 RepID=A0A4U0XZU8_9PEZI|nr:hypothetical protein B0A55_02287 [Friedmanniomyces simplex]
MDTPLNTRITTITNLSDEILFNILSYAVASTNLGSFFGPGSNKNLQNYLQKMNQLAINKRFHRLTKDDFFTGQHFTLALKSGSNYCDGLLILEDGYYLLNHICFTPGIFDDQDIYY